MSDNSEQQSVSLMCSSADRTKYLAKLPDLPGFQLNQFQVNDLEMLLCGGFAPLDGFMGHADYEACLRNWELADGRYWPMPLTLSIPDSQCEGLKPGDTVALRDSESVTLAVMIISDAWRPDLALEAEQLYGQNQPDHPGLKRIKQRRDDLYLGGRVIGLNDVTHYDARDLRHTPASLKQALSERGWGRVLFFHTQNVMHRLHHQIAARAARDVEANLLIHGAVGPVNPSDVGHLIRLRCYRKILNKFPQATTALSVLPLNHYGAGTRETMWQALISANYGATHFFVGHSQACGTQFNNKRENETRLDEELASRSKTLGVEIVRFHQVAYDPARAQFAATRDISPTESVEEIDRKELRRRLEHGLELPEWFSFPDILSELSRHCPPRHKQGFTVFFTGLSGAGKSTIANALMVKLMESGNRPVTLLDGDVVRAHLSSELGFSKAHRNINILRIGFVASEITKNGGIAICAPIAPYEEVRQKVRDMIEPHGTFVEVYVSTSLEVCEGRDRKGMYAAARAGKIKEFTGISDPYEVPRDAELTIDTDTCKPEEAVQNVLIKLEATGLISANIAVETLA